MRSLLLILLLLGAADAASTPIHEAIQSDIVPPTQLNTSATIHAHIISHNENHIDRLWGNISNAITPDTQTDQYRKTQLQDTEAVTHRTPTATPVTRSDKRLHLYLWIIVMLTIVLAISIGLIIADNRRLSKARHEIADLNSRLKTTTKSHQQTLSALAKANAALSKANKAPKDRNKTKQQLPTPPAKPRAAGCWWAR
ncbi:MAG: hypothetical protein K2N19_04160 [Muribaculaceae bacterium]|nr:hypothetical protein [Muribaculaceae bacterium]